ncbi:gamma-glutamyl phosphate reductase [Mycoplasma sp. CAG:956]|nr:gamma-glutamyl phosphate reductase [Mycoplasma sp. CAG:956]
MLDNNLDTIINKTYIIDKTPLNEEKIKKVIISLKDSIISSKEEITAANAIDIKNHNGNIIDFSIIERIFKNINNEKIYYGNVTTLKKDNNKYYGKQYFDKGNVLIFNTGNPYIILEIFLKNFLAGNTSIIVTTNYAYGLNKLLETIIKTVLETNNLSPDFINLLTTDAPEELLKNNYANIDLVIALGNKSFQNKITNYSKVPVLLSGYETFDLYIDEMLDKTFLTKIINLHLPMHVYINKNLKIDLRGSMLVDGVEEAIMQINYNGNGYSSAIFTSNDDNAANFISKVKSKIVTVNTSPTIERLMDIQVKDLVLEKTVIYPNKKKN